MTSERAVRLLAGTLVLIGLGLGLGVSPWYFILVGFVGVNLFQSALTGWCLAERIFLRLGLKPGCPQ
jgi:hypothetical protein